MVNYICEKCGKVFSQKCHYDNHMNKKIPCDFKGNNINEIVEEKIIDTISNINNEIKNSKIDFNLDLINTYKKMNTELNDIPSLDINEIKNIFGDDYKDYKKWLIDEGLNKDNLKQKKYETLHKQAIKLINEKNNNNNTSEVNTKDNFINNKEITRNILWKLEYTKTENSYESFKKDFISIIKKCQQCLYNNGSIVGNKAETDIIKVLCLKVLQNQFKNNETELYIRCNEIKVDNNINDSEFNNFKNYCDNLFEITKKDDIFKEWKIFVNKFLCKLFPNIYFENDNVFNCSNINGLTQLIQIISDFKIDEKSIEIFSSGSGNVHEYLREYSGKEEGGKSKLGQFFTPPKLCILAIESEVKNIIDNLLKDKKYNKENLTGYDPCVGTAGFLNILSNKIGLKSKNIYGCEIEKDTVKICEMNMILNSGKIDNNIINCDSISENPYLLKKKFNIITTNPPFGTDMNYDNLKNLFKNKFPTTNIKFENIYPINTNNGACLFVQHCFYILEEMGICAIILPKGQLFNGNSKWSLDFRKWLYENSYINTIINIPSGTFKPYTSCETKLVIFTKEKKSNYYIKFKQTNKECDEVIEMFDITEIELNNNNYSLETDDYVSNFENTYNNKTKKLQDICEIISNKKTNSSYGKNEKVNKYIYPLYYCSILGCKYLDNFEFNQEALIINATNGSGKCKIYYINGKYNVGNTTIHFKSKNNKEILNEYIYIFLKNNMYLLLNEFKGNDKKSITIGRFNNIKIPIPDIKTQKTIIEKCKKIDSILEENEKKYLTEKNNNINKLNNIFSDYC